MNSLFQRRTDMSNLPYPTNDGAPPYPPNPNAQNPYGPPGNLPYPPVGAQPSAPYPPANPAYPQPYGMPAPPGGPGAAPYPPYGQQPAPGYPPQGPYPNAPYQPPAGPPEEDRGMGKGLFSGKGLLGKAMKQGISETITSVGLFFFFPSDIMLIVLLSIKKSLVCNPPSI